MPPTSRVYSRAEYLSDAVVHVLGLAAAIGAVPVLIALAVFWHGDPSTVLGIAVYGATLIAMILFSALYNMIRHDGWGAVLKRLDHAAIYLKIAGTYTPFTVLSGGQGAALLTGLWGAALAGTSLKLIAPHRFRWLALALYLGMGWAGVIAGGSLLAALSPPVLTLIVAGGVLYTVGVAFFLAERLTYHNTIWHVFVLAATVLLFAAVVLHLADTSTATRPILPAPAD